MTIEPMFLAIGAVAAFGITVSMLANLLLRVLNARARKTKSAPWPEHEIDRLDDLLSGRK